MGALYLGNTKVTPAVVAGGGNYQDKNYTLTSGDATEITPDSGYDAMTSVTVTPSMETVNVTPSTSSQTKNPSSGKVGFSQVTVSAVTSSIDSNITQGNIKNGITILGVTGNYTGGGGYQIGTANKTTGTSRSTSIQFTRLKGEPVAFALIQATQIAASTSYVYVNAVTWDGSTHRIAYNNKRTNMSVSTSYVSHTYSNDTLTVNTSSSTNGGYFCTSCSYQLIYIY